MTFTFARKISRRRYVLRSKYTRTCGLRVAPIRSLCKRSNSNFLCPSSSCRDIGAPTEEVPFFVARRFLHIQEPSSTEPDNCPRGHASKRRARTDRRSPIRSKSSRELKRSFRRDRRTLVCTVTIPSRVDFTFVAQKCLARLCIFRQGGVIIAHLTISHNKVTTILTVVFKGADIYIRINNFIVD